MDSILNLSYDVFLPILSYVSQSDLASLCRVSKELRKFVEPILYGNVQIKIYRDDPYQNRRARGDFNLVHLLLRTILERPELVKSIQHAEFGTELITLNKNSDEFWAQFSIDHEDIQTFLSAAEKSSLSSEIAWTRVPEGKADKTGPLTALLLSHLSHLKSLTLADAFWINSKYIGRLFRSQSFLHLERIRCTIPEPREIVHLRENTQNVMSFFYLPALQDLSVVIAAKAAHRLPGTKDSLKVFEWRIVYPRATSITKLDISLLKPHHMAEVFSLTPNIKQLKWKLFHTRNTALNEYTLDCDKIVDALTTVQDTLQDLTIDFGFDSDYAYWPSQTTRQYIKGPLNLRSLRNIHKLELPMVLLFRPDLETPYRLPEMLPQNIRHVVVNTNGYGERADSTLAFTGSLEEDKQIQSTEEMEKLLKTLYEWLSDWRSVTPSLAKIEFYSSDLWSNKRWMKDFESIFTKSGLQFVLHVPVEVHPWWVHSEQPPHPDTYVGKYHKITNDYTLDMLDVELSAEEAQREGVRMETALENLDLEDSEDSGDSGDSEGTDYSTECDQDWYDRHYVEKSQAQRDAYPTMGEEGS